MKWSTQTSESSSVGHSQQEVSLSLLQWELLTPWEVLLVLTVSSSDWLNIPSSLVTHPQPHPLWTISAVPAEELLTACHFWWFRELFATSQRSSCVTCPARFCGSVDSLRKALLSCSENAVQCVCLLWLRHGFRFIKGSIVWAQPSEDFFCIAPSGAQNKGMAFSKLWYRKMGGKALSEER